MAEKPYSVCGLVRKTMGVRGKTGHSGRGFYEMEHGGLAADELFSRLEAAITEWERKGLVTCVERNPAGYTDVVLAEHLTKDGYYTTVRVTKHADLQVGM